MQDGEHAPRSDEAGKLDPPLFVLKYSGDKLVLYLPLCLLLTVGFGWTAVALPISDPAYAFGEFCIVLGTLLGIFTTVQTLLFDEVALYPERIIQKWHLIGQREILLKDAQLMIGPNETLIYPQDSRSFIVAYSKGVVYRTMMAKPKDVKTFTALLAQLSGREVDEINGWNVRMKRLIKEGVHG
jgi:hypothetical protein